MTITAYQFEWGLYSFSHAKNFYSNVYRLYFIKQWIFKDI